MGVRPQKLKEVEFYGLYTIENQRSYILWALDHRNSKKLKFMGLRPQKLKVVEF